jgi:NADH-quinone oxidoreductase subunit E
VQINDDYYEDLTGETFAGLLDDLVAGRPVKKGSQTGRLSSEPLGELTTLIEPSLYRNREPSGRPGAPLTDGDAKKPGEAGNAREAPAPTPPIADSSDAGRR